jgi:SAM-dependent methyltransferase
MHPTALRNCQHFFDVYAGEFSRQETKVVEIGSQDVNGSLRGCCPASFSYVGVDFVAGKGVDLVLSDPYALPFEAESVDIALSSSCFEHSEMFWLLYLEILRILKPGGLFYLNVPSNGGWFHRYPVDCWRFFPDSGRALVTWAKRNGLRPALLESYVSVQVEDVWNDFVAVYLKDEDLAPSYPRRILDTKRDIYNGVVLNGEGFIDPSPRPEDEMKLQAIKQIVDR